MATQPRNEYDQRVAAQQTPEREKLDFAALAKQLPTWGAPELETLWERFDQIRSLADFRFFLYYAKGANLDPMTGEVVPAYRWDPIKQRETLVPIVTIGVLRKRRAAECDGLDEFKFAKDGAALVSASGTIYRKNCAHPFSSTVFYDEYVPTDRRGNISSIWAGKGHMLLSKCLEAQLTRLAFFDLVGDVLIEEETQRNRPEEPGADKAPADEFTVGEKSEPAAAEVKTAAPEPAKKPKPEPEPEPVKKPEPVPDKPKPVEQPLPVAAKATEPAPPTDKEIADAHATFGSPDAPPPTAAQPKPEPPPLPPPAAEPPLKMSAAMAAPTFDEMIAHISKLIGGETKPAHELIRRYFAGFLGVKVVPKDRSKLLDPLKKLVVVISTNVGNRADVGVVDLKANPELLGSTMAGRTNSPLEEEFALLKWPPPIQGLARQVMRLLDYSEADFIKWIHFDVAGTGANALSIARMEPAALEILLPLYLLVKGRAFEVIDWAISNDQPATKTLIDMVGCTNKPIGEWDSAFAVRILDAISDAAKGEPAQPKAPPADDLENWSSAGLPFEM